jgi:hypothetical protein
MHSTHISTGVRHVGQSADANVVNEPAAHPGRRTRAGRRRAAAGTEFARLLDMLMFSRFSFALADRRTFGWQRTHRRLVIGAGLLVLATFAAGAVRAAEPAGAVSTARSLSTPPGTMQVVAVPAALVHPVPAGLVVARALAPQAARPEDVGAAVEPPAAGLGTMLLSLMALVGWIALRRR